MRSRFCLLALARAISCFTRICVRSSIDEDVLPSITGLINLYAWHERTTDQKRPYFSNEVALHLGFHAFSGLAIAVSSNKDDDPTLELAKAGGGICALLRILEDPLEPLSSITQIRIHRGYIGYSGSVFQGIRSLEDHRGFNDTLPDALDSFFDSNNPFFDMVVQETMAETHLEVAYTMRSRETPSTIMWLDLGAIFKVIRQSESKRTCVAEHLPKIVFRTMNGKSNFESFINGDWLQEVKAVQGLGEKWVLACCDKRTETIELLIVGSNLPLYFSVAAPRPHSRMTFPLNICLCCMFSTCLSYFAAELDFHYTPLTYRSEVAVVFSKQGNKSVSLSLKRVDRNGSDAGISRISKETTIHV